MVARRKRRTQIRNGSAGRQDISTEESRKPDKIGDGHGERCGRATAGYPAPEPVPGESVPIALSIG